MKTIFILITFAIEWHSACTQNQTIPATTTWEDYWLERFGNYCVLANMFMKARK